MRLQARQIPTKQWRIGSCSTATHPLLQPCLKFQHRCMATQRTPAPVQCAAGGGDGSLPDFQNVKGILFDIDGTLLNSDELHFQAFNELLPKYGGKAVSEEYFREKISGGHNPVLAAMLWPDRSEGPAECRPPKVMHTCIKDPNLRCTALYLALQDWCNDWMDEKEALFRSMAGDLKPIAGLKEFLAWIETQQLGKVAVTNAPRANMSAMLAGIGLGNYFDHVVLGEECARAKPFPDPYLEGLKFLDIAPSEALVFEDSLSGIGAGVAADIPVVGITTTQAPERLKDAGCKWIIDDYTALAKHCQNLKS